LLDFYCKVLGIVATADSLFDSLGGAVRKLLSKRSCIPVWKTYNHRCFAQ